MSDVRNMLEDRLPGLHGRIEKELTEAEAHYNKQAGQVPSEFLLDHTRRTAAIAYKISTLENEDPFLPTLVALYHDAGKFHGGEYHSDDMPEEKHAAVMAGAMLGEFGLDEASISAVLEALRALYDDNLLLVGPCRIVQDADQLDKLGALGVGAFFTKAALRGRGMIEALVQTLSRELTYALAAPKSMFTETGKRLASQQADKTIAFFDDLLGDLENWGIASFERRTIILEEDFRTREGALVPKMEVSIVMPSTCPECDASLELTHLRERGVKCEKLIALFACIKCDYARETYFCLPVFA